MSQLSRYSVRYCDCRCWRIAGLWHDEKVVGLRLSQEDEHEGADLAIHKISAVMDDLQS